MKSGQGRLGQEGGAGESSRPGPQRARVRRSDTKSGRNRQANSKIGLASGRELLQHYPLGKRKRPSTPENDLVLVAIISPYQTVNPHFEAELELYQHHLDAGDAVVYWACLGRRMGLELLSQPGRALPLLPSRRPLAPQPTTWPAELPWQFTDLDQLRQLQYENFDIGYACLSSLVSAVREPLPDLNRHASLLRQLLWDSWRVYRATRQRLQAVRPDQVYVFNGRFAMMRAVLRAAQREGVKCLIHERGGTFNRYQLFENHLPHDLTAMQLRIQAHWQEADPQWRQQAGGQWFIDRRNRIERGWKSFVKQQRPHLLPDDWNPEAHNVVLFCSSEDEFVAIGGAWNQRPYASQVDGVRHLLSLCQRPNIRLTVRLHPNLQSAPDHLTTAFYQIQDPRLSVIAPDSPVDSYQLMERASTVVTFGSSVGIEAVYWGRPSVLLGPSFYRPLGGTYQPIPPELTQIDRQSPVPPQVQELADCLNRPLDPLPTEGALQLGFWLQENGHEYRYYRADGFNEGTFKGQVVYARPPKSWLAKLRGGLKALAAPRGR
jgi:hypothetical protein